MSAIEQQAERELAKVEGIAARKRQMAKETPAALALINLKGFAQAEAPATSYILDGWLPRGYVSLLGAHGGAGKSYIALALCAHCACGQSWAGRNAVQGRAVFLSIEDPESMVKLRLKRIVAAHDLDAGMIEHNLVLLDGTKGDGTLGGVVEIGGAKSFGETLAFGELREHARGACLVVVDNASDAFDGNENDRRNVRAFMRLLAQLARENDAAVLLLAHVDKQSAKYGAANNTYSGSTAWHNSARSRLALVEADGAIELRHEKHQFGKLAETVRLAWNDGGVLMPAGAGTSGPTDRDKADDASVLAALRAAAVVGTIVPSAPTGPSTAQHVLTTFTELDKVLHGTAGRARFWASIHRLLRSGCASSEEYRNENRKLRTKFVPNDLRQCAGAPIPPHPPIGTGAGAHGPYEGLCQSTTSAEPAQTSAGEAEL